MAERARKIKALAATAAATTALAVPAAARADVNGRATGGNASPATPLEEPAESGSQSAEAAPQPTEATPLTPAPLKQGETLGQPPADSNASGGVTAGEGKGAGGEGESEEPAATELPGIPAPDPSGAFLIPSIPSSSCAATGVPPVLIPIYQRASATYELGPQGPAILAAINLVETNFGSNLGPSSAGAVGWMQFMPETWASYGVDANGDGIKDPSNPEDAIYAAAGYLRAAGMPADVYGAIFAYNHADWYVAEVLANAGCYAGQVGATLGAAEPQLAVYNCTPAEAWRRKIPAEYLRAFEDAAARYDLGRRGVWALAAVARLESDFGRGMSTKELERVGALGLEPSEWDAYAVDGDHDGRVRHADPDDSAATLARLIWSRGDLGAGLFTHNQAEWYVQAVLAEADRLEGECRVRHVDWALAPLASSLETAGPEALLQGNLASAPEDAPAAVKAVIAAANSIASTPYVWGGGHGSWYSYGYDCSGAVSFALYGGGMLTTPLVSGALASYGEPGPGRWITIYANAEHVYMEVAGLRFDTAGNPPGVSGPRWHGEPPYPDGYVIRHPPGY